MPQKKGQTGNPNGRPLKSRALTEILGKAGAKTVEYQGHKIAGRRLLAVLVWQGVTTGNVTMPDGTKFELSVTDWRAFIEFLYKHIDGPPPQNLDVTSMGQKLEQGIIRIVDHDDGDSA